MFTPYVAGAAVVNATLLLAVDVVVAVTAVHIAVSSADSQPAAATADQRKLASVCRVVADKH